MSKRGFTLLEIVASVAVLGIVVVVMAMLFADSETAWQLGTERARTAMSAQTALEIIGRDLKHAVADSNFVFRIQQDENTNSVSYGFYNDLSVLVSMQNKPVAGTRTAAGIVYWVRRMSDSAGPAWRYELVRSISTDSVYQYTNWFANTNWHNGVVVDNIAAFRLWAMDGVSGQLTDYTNDVHTLPPFVDVYLELLDDTAARQAARMQDGHLRNNFIDVHARRYTSRINFLNRNGYKQR